MGIQKRPVSAGERNDWIGHLRGDSNDDTPPGTPVTALPAAHSSNTTEDWINHLRGDGGSGNTRVTPVAALPATPSGSNTATTLPDGGSSKPAKLPPLHRTPASGAVSSAAQQIVPPPRSTAPARTPKMASALVMKAASKFLRKEPDPVQKAYKPLPDGVAINIPGIATAWMIFQRVDVDDSGRLDQDEVCRVVKLLGLAWSKKRLRHAFDEMATADPTAAKGAQRIMGVSFHDFAQWWARNRAAARRDMRRKVKELFESADDDKSGVLDKEEFAGLVARANKDSSLPTFGGGGGDDSHPDHSSSPMVDVEGAWAEIRKTPFRDGKGVGVNFHAFEGWWKSKVGIDDPDIPVLPEYMVSRINEKWENQKIRSAAIASNAETTPPGTTPLPLLTVETRGSYWDILRSKLSMLVQIQNTWGQLWDLYETRTESVYDEESLPELIRDPDSRFSAGWDLTSVVFLVFVTATVPLRACFGVDVALWSVGFFVDLTIDVYFIVDLVINFRTAYWDRNGFREFRPKKIAAHYMRGWFVIDLVSCLPIGYLQYFWGGGGGAGGDDNLRSVKSLRLMKMTKMLRLGRIKRILSRQTNTNIQSWLNIGFTLFTITFIVHMLACFFYLIGEGGQTLGNGVYVPGWVEMETDWWTNYSPTQAAAAAQGTTTELHVLSTAGDLSLDERIGLGVRYSTSMYYVLNALESSYTTHERNYAVMADFARDIILGLVASLITTISMSMSSDDTEINLKLGRLRNWLRVKRFPKPFQRIALEHFNELWMNQSFVDLPELLQQCSPTLASTMASLLYGRTLSGVPMFKGLSKPVIGALAQHCQMLHALKDQIIISQDEPGKEMYMVLVGEVEVTMRCDVSEEEVRLGFLSEGAFFGEAPVLAANSDVRQQMRTRTVRAVTRTELCYLTREAIMQLCEDYQELNARVLRFQNSSRVITEHSLNKVDLSRPEMDQLRSQFKAKVRTSAKVRVEKNFQEGAYIPASFLPAADASTIQVSRMKKKVGTEKYLSAYLAEERLDAPRAGAAAPVGVGGGGSGTVAGHDTAVPSIVEVERRFSRMLEEERRERQAQQLVLEEERRERQAQQVMLTRVSEQLSALLLVNGAAES